VDSLTAVQNGRKVVGLLIFAPLVLCLITYPFFIGTRWRFGDPVWALLIESARSPWTLDRRRH